MKTWFTILRSELFTSVLPCCNSQHIIVYPGVGRQHIEGAVVRIQHAKSLDKELKQYCILTATASSASENGFLSTGQKVQKSKNYV